MTISALGATTTHMPAAPSRDEALRDAARKLEAQFLAQMLKEAGVGKPLEGLGGGGIGEEQFTSFLVHAEAEKLVEHGGIGLAESLYEALKERSDV